MKKFLSCLVLTSFVLNNTLIMSPAFAKKAGSTALSIKASDGTAIVYGSILSPRSNRLKIKLTSAILSAIRSQGIDNAQITITKIAAENETSNVYSISSDNVDIIGKSLVFDVVPCTDTSGATVTAGALAAGTYTLNITIGSTSASGTFEFNPPAVVVGTVDPGSSGSCTGGTNNISSISGDSIGQLVALSNNCTYFNEVQASRKAGKKGKKGKNRLAAQEDGSSTSSGDAADAGFYEDPNAGSTDTAIVEVAVVVTDEDTGTTDIEELSAPVNLDPENNGDATNVSEETTQTVDAALDLIVGDQTGDGVTDEEDIQEVANEDAGEVIDQLEQALDDSAVIEEITDDGTTGEVVGEQFQPASDCGDKIMSVVGTVDLMTVTDTDLKTIGGKLIPEIQTGSLVDCVPPFVKDFIPSFFKNICGDSTTQCDDGLIAFAKKFLFNVGKNENQPPVDPKQICQKLKEGLSGLKNCKGEGCPPPPCFPQDLREKLKAECAELVATLPVDCQPPQAVCNLQPKGPQGPNGGQPPAGGTSTTGGQPPTGGTSGQTPPPPPGTTSGQPVAAQLSPGSGPLGAAPNGDQCMDAGKPQDASICKLCNTAGPEGCTGPVLIPSNMADDGSTCVLPEVQCIPFTSLSATSPDAMFDGICLFGDGDLTVGEEDDKPKDPRSCKPFPFDPKLGCPQLRPSCKPSDDLSTFDKVCCQLPQGQPGGPNGGPGNPGGQPPTGGTSGQVPPPPGGTTTTSGQPPVARLTQDQVDGRVNECVLRKLCSDPSNFGEDGKPDSTKLDALKTACSGQGQPGGMSGQPGNSACIQECKSKCGEDQACLQECGKSCQPTGGTSGQPPCDPAKDPNCKPPTGGTSGQPPCDPLKDPNCKPPTGGTSGQPPCDPAKDPNCVPPTGGTSGQPPCDPAKDPNCKPPTDGTTGTSGCPQGQVKDPATGQCKPADGGTTGTSGCPQGQVKDPATGQCKPADGGTTGTSGCPQGQVKDPATGQCKPADGGTTGTSGCPQGQVKDPATGQCKPADGGTTGTSGCPQGQVKDPATGQCKPADGGTTQPPPVTCPQGQVLCSDGKTCKTTTAECPTGGTQPPPATCPTGTVKCSDGSCKASCS